MRPERPPPLNDPQSREREQLATFLAIALTVVFGGAFVAFLIFVSLGLFLWVIVLSGLIALYTGVHYLIWGPRKAPADEGTIDVEPTRAETRPDDSLEDRTEKEIDGEGR
jgi:hypothetical protein